MVAILLGIATSAVKIVNKKMVRYRRVHQEKKELKPSDYYIPDKYNLK